MRHKAVCSAEARRPRLALWLCSIAALLTVWAVPSRAQTPPPAGAFAPFTSPLPRVLPQQQPQVIPPTPPAAEAAPAPPAGGPVRVDEIRVEGVTVYDAAALQAGYANAVGAEVPRARLDEIVQSLQTRYLDDGYILTLVRGRFERANGRVVFVIHATEGYISDVKLDGDIGPAGSLVYDILSHLTESRPVNNSELERYLLLANDIPGVSVQAVMRRGTEQAGAVELIARQSRREYSALMNFDNRGSNEAGPPEILISGSTNSFTSWGDRLQATMFNTFNLEQIFGQVDGDLSIGSEGLKFHGYFGRGSNEPGGILEPTGFNGTLEIGGGRLTYPIVRSRRFNLYVHTDLDQYSTQINVIGTKTASHFLSTRTGASVDLQDTLIDNLPAANSLNVTVSHGIMGTSNTRPSNRIDYNKVGGDLTRVQDLPMLGDVRPALKLAVGGQYSNDILPPSERFFLGGTRFGRGFFNGEVTGDKAIGSTVELQLNTRLSDLPLVPADYQVPTQFYGFYDYGRGYNLAPGDPSYTIQSVGLGFRADVTDWALIEVEGVHRLTTHPQGPSVATEAKYAFFGRLTLHY